MGTTKRQGRWVTGRALLVVGLLCGCSAALGTILADLSPMSFLASMIQRFSPA
jgi:hypothetical protein